MDVVAAPFEICLKRGFRPIYRWAQVALTRPICPPDRPIHLSSALLSLRSSGRLANPGARERVPCHQYIFRRVPREAETDS